jgi:TonB family protein
LYNTEQQTKENIIKQKIKQSFSKNNSNKPLFKNIAKPEIKVKNPVVNNEIFDKTAKNKFSFPDSINNDNNFSDNLNLYDYTFDINELQNNPKKISGINPIYPIKAKFNEIDGFVEIEYIIDVQGNIKNIRIIKSQPDKIFEDSVLNAVKNWKYESGMINNKPVEFKVRKKISFFMEDK